MREEWLTNARIFIVDDEPANVEFLERLLAENGFRNILSTTNSRAFAALFQAFDPDLILLDWLMPHHDGAALLELIERLTPAQSYLPVLVLTADITPATRRRALSSGAKDFLTKPFEIAEVLLRIRNLLETRYLHLELRQNIERLEQAEAEARRGFERERELSDLKSRFISMTSHEFRTPLSTILSSAELLEHYAHRWPEAKRQEHFKRIQQAVRYMTTLLEEVLFIGRADASRLTLQRAPVDLLDFCTDLVEEYQLSAGPGHRLRLVAEGESERAFLDMHLLRQALGNLLSNAIKYSPAGGEIILEIQHADAAVILQVRDGGLGIPAEAMPHLYEVFHRAANVEHIPGHGLGLAIVRRAVDLHGGTIDCVSALGQGTTFTITLPRAHSADREPAEQLAPIIQSAP